MQPAQLEFQACSGATLDQMNAQMDQIDPGTKVKAVVMEAGGNNANFYPLADACLFHYKLDGYSRHDYGPDYEEDNAEDRKGECRHEFDWVRSRVDQTSGLKEEVRKTIHLWRRNSHVVGNNASLFPLSYPWFFGPSDDCDNWSFALFYALKYPKLVKAMRDEFNELVNLVNGAIREAVEYFNDEKIVHIDINPAFNGHRFCEIGYTEKDQLNASDKVRIFNRSFIENVTTRHGNNVKTYIGADGSGQGHVPDEEYPKLKDHRDGEHKREGDWRIFTFRDPDDTTHTMEISVRASENNLGSDDPIGLRARTLHPKQLGHEDMAVIIIQQLKKQYQANSINCLTGCKRFSPGAISCPDGGPTS